MNIKKFDIVAINANIVYNKNGDHDPNGKMYVLKEYEEEVKKAIEENPHKPVKLVQPLVVRVNVGDLVEIKFKNKTDMPASIHIQGDGYNVNTSDGANVGFNKNTIAKKGKTKKYKWYAKREGTFLFHDMADTSSTNNSANLHGLFGAIIVEPVGATWTDPETGEDLDFGINADIHHPYKEDWREYVTLFHDEPEVYDINGNTTINPETGLHDGTMPINYRAEPGRSRIPAGTGGVGEEVSMSSWPFGDPAVPLLRAYVGDPIKWKLIHAGIKETHVFHFHNHQWRLETDDPKSTLIDSISFSPQQCIEFTPVFGAGSLTKTIGDVIWHCHLYPHFMQGMWGLLRILDRLEDGTRKLPDGTISPKLVPLPDREEPLKPDEMHPGYPNFILGETGKKATKPPLGIIGEEARGPTSLEEANLIDDYEPGQLYSKTFKDGAPIRVFDIVAIQLPIIYNKQGWNDPEGRIFVLKEDKEDIIAGKKKIEPLVIRANAGENIEVRFINELPESIGPNAFQIKTETTEAGYHIHLVKFDTIPSDGSANGYCNDASAVPNDTLIERFYADDELKTVFFHDHLFPNAHQQHGLFGGMIIEPAGSEYYDMKTGKEIKSGTQAIIKPLMGKDFREFTLFVHDFALLYDKDGNPLNPPSAPGSHDDQGVMGINYKCEPLMFRKGDPAYSFSSHIHGDPCTPIMEAYEGDSIIIRLLDGAFEEQHSFNIHGMRFRKEIKDEFSPIINSQTLGISEAFNFEIDEDYTKGDYLYYFGGMDDLWLGLWGLIRVYDKLNEDLIPLSDRKKLKKDIKCKKTEDIKIEEKFEESKENNEHTKEYKKIKKPEVVKFLCKKKNKKVRRFDIVAIQKNIVYNKYGDHDPNGLMFVRAKDEEAVLSGKMEPKPLILRANAGDLIEVKLTNHLFKKVPESKFPEVPVQTDYLASNRVSLHANLLKYDVLSSDGTTVGYNPDQTIGVGETITYKWYADEELGACLLTGFADIMNHRKHGLFGAIIIEPPESKYFCNSCGLRTEGGDEEVIVSNPEETFREIVLFIQNGLALYNKSGELIDLRKEDHEEHERENIEEDYEEETEDGHEEEDEDFDTEDQGQKGFNYRSERFENRLKKNKNLTKVMDSFVHGDPATPVFKAYTGDNVRIRLIMPADKPRNIGFVIHGHSWRQQDKDPLSPIVSSTGAISVGNVFNYTLKDGANCLPGDYCYRSGSFRWDVEQGMWGILRIYDKEQSDLYRL